MNWYKIFYLVSVADSLLTVLGTLAIIGLIWTVINIVAYLIQKSEDGDYQFNKWHRRANYTAFWIGLICMISWVLTPSKKDMLLIVTGGTVGNFITSDSSAKAIPSEITTYLHKALKKEIAELDDDTKRELDIQTPKEKTIDKFKDFTKEQIIDYLKSDTTIVK